MQQAASPMLMFDVTGSMDLVAIGCWGSKSCLAHFHYHTAPAKVKLPIQRQWLLSPVPLADWKTLLLEKRLQHKLHDSQTDFLAFPGFRFDNKVTIHGRWFRVNAPLV